MNNETVAPDSPQLVARFFEAMQAAGTQEAEMLQLFAEDAVYIEPFTGQRREHVGKAAIREAMVMGWKFPLPEMRIEVDRITTDGQTVRADWTCYSPGLPNGRGAGTNEFTLRAGLIVRLETRLRVG
jgi:ketosteroid isomerase-like protein